MKILAIRGKNLASLNGEFEIDFRKEPLRSAGLFAITGSTGSGKTTILDAMCIALYATSPRLEKIKDSNTIEGSGNNKVTENNPKTILRRGCHEGYAEVEFLAVDGNEYRTRWSISRSNANANGNFRRTEHDLFNMSTGEHSSLKTKEFKSIIPNLVGLTYEQFTRSVLLAQGEFAAFLNATENEKAKILQTLTGTEIYSRISAAIYRHYTESNKKLEIIEAKKKALAILMPEEKSRLLDEKKAMDTEIHKYDILLQHLTAKKEWLERAEQYRRLYATAQEEVRLTDQKRSGLKPVADMLKQIDSIQDIRDSYMQMRSIAQQRDRNVKELAALQEELKTKGKKYVAIQNEVKSVDEKQQEINREWNDLKPIIREAVKIEENIAAHTASAKEIANECARMKAEKRTLKESAANLKTKSSNLEKEQEMISVWFAENAKYENIIPVIPSIIANKLAIDSASLQIKEKEKAHTKAKELLFDYEKKKNEIEKRKEELESTLASEIAELRRQLIAGEPCPVCGSRHHETTASEGKTLAEKELAEAKKEVKEMLAHITTGMENCKSEADKLQSAIETYRNSIVEFEKNNSELLGKNVAEIRKENYTVGALTAIATKWKEKKEKSASIKEEMSVIANTIQTSQTRIQELDCEIEKKEKRQAATAVTITGLKEKVAEMLGSGNTTDGLEKRYGERIAAINKLFSDNVEKRAAIADEYNRLKGKATEKERFNRQQEELCVSLKATIAEYLQKRNDGMTAETLEDLIEKDSNEVAAMRERIDLAEKSATKAAATQLERKRNIEEHEKSEARPAEDENKENIECSIDNTRILRKEAMEKSSSISAILIKDNENNEIFGKYKEEYKQLSDITEDWKTLNNMFGSAEGDKLMRITQEYTLDILLNVANRHLQEFSGRYRLSRISAGSLGIKVIDLEMMQDNRSVHTLSGGETFIASLALSLALSSISSNKMSIGSLFIDEGFGALDSDTLRSAIDALEKLKGKERKIGVISHLNEMLDRIPTRIRVIKGYNGKSRIEI